MMKCAISGRVPNFPVISKTSGHVFEKELIEKHIRDYGKCPKTGGSLAMDDIIAIITSNSKKESAFPQLPDRIAKEIKVTRRKLSGHRIHRYRKISPSLATVDALQGSTFSNDYTLHKTEMPGVLSMDIDNSRGIIATGGADTTVVVFDLLSRKTVSTLSGHSKKVTSVKFVNESELVVTGSGDNTVRVWKRSEKGSYKCRDILDHHTAEVQAVTIHPSQKYFVTASFDCTWQFHDLASQSHAPVARCKGSESFSTAVFHPDGRILGTCASDLVRFWDVAKQDDILKIDAHTGRPLTSIAFSENGYTLATAARDSVKLWDLRFLRTMKTFPSDKKYCVLSDYLLKMLSNSIPFSWKHIMKEADCRVPYTKDSYAFCICFRSDLVDFDHSGKYLAAGGACISIYDVAAAPNLITTFSHMSDIGDLSCVKFGKDAKYVAAAGTSDSKLLLFGVSKGTDS